MGTASAKNMYGMFGGLGELTELNLIGFKTSNVIDMSYMFMNTPKLINICVGNAWDDSNANITDMFSGCGTNTVTQNNNT